MKILRKFIKNNNLENFNKELYVDKIMQDKITLYMLRMILFAGGFREFIDSYNSFREDDIALFLDLYEYVNRDDFDKKEVYDKLMNYYIKLSKKNIKTNKTLENNLKKISKLLNFTQVEKDILEFYILLSQYDILSETAHMIGNSLNFYQIKKTLSKILNYSINEIEKALSYDSPLIKSSLLKSDNYRNLAAIDDFFEVNKKFAEKMLNININDISVLFEDIIKKCSNSSLTKDDYPYLSEYIEDLIIYLKDSVLKKQKGVNILFYGLPGSGKTEFAKLLANELGIELFEISYINKNEPIDEIKRLDAYNIAQSMFSKKNILLMYDEAEDIFDSYDNLFFSKKQKNKAFINKMLENNNIPTIWITNDIKSVDNAIIRRFDFVLEFKLPNKKQRKAIIQKYAKDMLTKNDFNKLLNCDYIAPAIIERAVKVANIHKEKTKKSKTIIKLIDQTLKAQGYDGILKTKKKKLKTDLPKSYDLEFINCDANLEEIINGIKKTKNARICLYGAPGTGKSAFGKYIAKQLKKEYIIKKGSDLLSMWVGGTEKNIADAFKEAKDKKAVLIFDEVDSFLNDRNSAVRNFEITQVNEMLTQMESFDGIFIATTNLIDNLDKASLRRFDLKLKFDYLKPTQALKLFEKYAKELKIKISKKIKNEILNLNYLTPGDFNTIIRQSKFRPIKNDEDFFNRLIQEVSLKGEKNTINIGF